MALTLLKLVSRLFLKERTIEIHSVTNSAAEASTAITFGGMSKVEFVTTDAPILTVTYNGNQVTITHAAGLDFRVLALGVPLG